MKQTLSISPPIAVAKSDGNVTADGAHTHRKFRHYITDYQGNNTAVVSDSGAILEQTGYFPYGEPFREPSHPYTFSDNERLHAGGQNQYDFHARRLIPTLLRFDCPDPLMEKYPHLSPYIYCASNPIMLTDRYGMEFTERAEKSVEKLTYRIQSMEADLNKRIDGYKKKLQKQGISEKERNKLNNKIDKANSKLNELNQVSMEIETLRSSSQVYDIVETTIHNRSNGYEVEINSLTDFTNGVVMIELGSSDISFLAHELKHAYQFETGQYNFGKTNYFRDIYDEVEAYKRGALFGGSEEGIRDGRYSNLLREPTDIHVLGKLVYENDSLLQSKARRKEVIFRWNNVTYNGTKR